MDSTFKELKTAIRKGSVKNVVAYGETKNPPALPYVLLQPEPKVPDCQAFQVWVFMAMGKNAELEDYVKHELPELIYSVKNILGQPKYKSNGTYDGVGADVTKGSLVAGKLFYLPLIIR